MKIDLLQLVQSCKIFSAIDEASLKDLLHEFTRVHLKKNQILFHQGEISTDLFLLVRGKLVVIVKTFEHEKRAINEIFPGETIGELGALSNEPRTATIKAAEDSILLKLSGEAFRKLCTQYPSIMLEMMDIFVNRSRNLMRIISAEESGQRNIILLPANNESSLTVLLESLNKLIEKNSKMYFIDEQTDIKNIEALERKYSTLVYCLSSPQSALAKIGIEKADKIYLVAAGKSNPEINRAALDFIREKKATTEAKPDLILLHENENTPPINTAKWLKLTRFALHHHIRMNQPKDLRRLLRFINGTPIALVLGGGGLRCWAHLGVIKALMDTRIPIDILGGTSAGAIVAGHYAIHEAEKNSLNELSKLSEITREAISMRNFTWPAVSLFDSKAYTAQIKRIFKQAKIENLWLPTFYVSCNLSDNTQVIHRHGYLWKAIRTSTAVPAIFPPVVINGEIHLDGGILNNLPVDIMRKLVGKRAAIIASELTHRIKDGAEYHFPPVLTFSDAILAKIKIAHKDYKFPSFIDTFLHSLLAGSSAKQEENGLISDVLISPDLTRYGLLNVTEKQEHELIEIGYRSATEAIKKWQKKIHKNSF